MNTLQAIALGAMQGATEFLPVSSSGHLVVARELFQVADVPVLFDVLLHVATLLAVVVVLRRRVWAFITALGRWGVRRATEQDRPYLRLIPIIIVTTAVTGAVGVGLDASFDIRNPRVTSGLFLVTAVLLILTKWARGSRAFSRIGWIDSVVLGLAQGFGVLPGISRSGVTISAALYSGMDRKTAGEYSFLLSIPAILGALVLTLRDAEALRAQVAPIAVVAGCLAAAIVGFLALVGLLRLVQAGRMYYFAAYLIPLGIWGLFTF
jgi:undecaprenyl-diphosphatase